MTQKDPLADLPWPGAAVAPSQEVSGCIRAACTKGLCKKRGLSMVWRTLATLGLAMLILGYYTFYALTGNRPLSLVRTALLGALGWLVAQVLIVIVALARPPGLRASRAMRVGLVVALALAFVCYVLGVSSERLSVAQFSRGYPAWHA